jgi:hypothetical protein
VDALGLVAAYGEALGQAPSLLEIVVFANPNCHGTKAAGHIVRLGMLLDHVDE